MKVKVLKNFKGSWSKNKRVKVVFNRELYFKQDVELPPPSR